MPGKELGFIRNEMESDLSYILKRPCYWVLWSLPIIPALEASLGYIVRPSYPTSQRKRSFWLLFGEFNEKG
jgi:hypothetical protein